MAESSLLGLAQSVLEQIIVSPALEELSLVWNLKEDLERLGETIETITCFIYDAEQRQSKERLVELWLSRLRAVLYDADDLFDAIAARDLHKQTMDGNTCMKEVFLFFSKYNQLGFIVKTPHAIKDIRESLDRIKDDMYLFHFQNQRIEENRSHRVLEREERHSFVDSKAVIGRDQEKEDIIKLLLAENTRQRSFEVISVIGFEGLGKTTLAQLVYNDQRVQMGFDLCLWTCINYLSDIKSVLVTILTSALNSKPRDLGLDQLQREFRKKIEGKKYLLVLDDVWDDNLQNWGRLEPLLACGKIGSKVLITTRKVGVAKCLKAVEPYYRLNTLSEESAWSLFVKVAFKDEGFVGDSELDSLGKQIIRKCGCVPLLVSLIGTMLGQREKDKEVWLSFLENEFAGVVAGDTGNGNVTPHAIKDIRESLDHIKDDMSHFQFRIQRVEENRSHRVREERHSYVDSKVVIGRDREKEDIIKLLLAENTRQRSFEVISVIGFEGLGKTTLAQLVYNDQRVQMGFDLCLWTCINYLSDIESVLVTILTSALNSNPRDLGLDQLQREFRKKIEGKKYLLVLDDVWDDNLKNWGRLETLLACGKIGSKVLITTRKVGVAKCLKAVEPYYRLNTLSEESAWSLFVKVAFKDEGFVGDSELYSLGKQIIRKCGCVPLLVSLIGTLLGRREKDKEVWRFFLENEFAGVVAGDTGDGNVMQIMKVSYIDLPATLKRCFAYCSIFPEDYVFDKDELVRMWIAQGFVEPFAGKSLDEVGDGYFFSLIDRCFFQEAKEYEWDFGVVRYACKMHDLLHKLATQVAGTESIRYSDEDSQNMAHLRHISITPPFSNSLSLFQNLSSCSKSLRSLTEHHIEINSLKLVLEKFRNLRTLVLPNMNHTTLPDSFGELIHLRYLDLSQNSNLTALPKSIYKLHHLQTLLLTDCSNLVKFPSTLAKLVSLRHLFLEGCSTLDSMPSGFAGLTSLVSLDWFIMHPVSGGLRYLHGLDMLRGTLKLELPMKGWTDCVKDAKEANMASKGEMSGLSIKWTYGESNGEDLKGEERKAVVDELQPHVHLRYLEIGNYTSDKLPMWFSSLSNVNKLRLERCNKVEYLDESVRCDSLMPHLEVLELRRMDCLRGWCSEATSTVHIMPCVSKLDIHGCTSLVENMPLFDALRHLTLSEVNVKLVNMLLSCPNVQCSPGCHNSKLQVLYLSFIEGLECLPEGLIKHLTALKVLDISDCEDLRWISRRGLACLTSLEELRITSIRDVRLEDEDDDKKMCMEINNMYHGLQRLRVLHVHWHHDMYYGLCFLISLQELKLTYYDEQQVEADNRNSECCNSAPEQLQRVELKFKGMKCCFPKWTLHLPCLRGLILWNCKEMNVEDWVAQQTQSTTLDTLSIHSDEDLLWVQNIPWNLLPSLHTLNFYRKLSTIPDGIQHLTSLQYLEIGGCQNLGEIPKWMKNLTSLQELFMRGCSPELKARCTPQTGTDWDLISHIPLLDISLADDEDW